MSTENPGFVPMDPRWQGILTGQSVLARGQRLGRRIFSLVPAGRRWKFCNAPFRGPYSGIFGVIGYTPSRKNPAICERCIERAPEGGALAPVTVLFADVRGYTSLAERLSSVETTGLLNRFYQTASGALLAHDAILGQIAGDEVMAIFVPGLAGPQFPRRAVQAAEALLRSMGYGRTGHWLDVGVGICTGEEYVGNVGGGGFKDFTAIGDVTNTAARLQASAAGGEIFVCATTYEAVAQLHPDAEPRRLVLKGKDPRSRASESVLGRTDKGSRYGTGAMLPVAPLLESPPDRPTRAPRPPTRQRVGPIRVWIGRKRRNWYRIPESRQASGGVRLSTLVTVGSGQFRWVPAGLGVHVRVRA